jgi:VanZ family protein
VIAPWLRWFIPTWSADDIEGLHLLLRKLGHLSEYFVFALLIMRVLHAQAEKALGVSHLFLATVLVVFHAISDELHQAFVPSRSSSAVDILIDVCGRLAGAWCFYFWQRRKDEI